MTEADNMFISVVFGVIGTGYFVYGKKNARLVPLLAGMALCVFPYFISDTMAILAVGLGLTIGPWFLRQES
ncbi:MAG: hypothetical protein JWO94_245 [Verrucomicrobiaceae bacterium]|nr:hypothetical protein [Verrucomicrobiaceae bacterium]